MVGVRLRRRQPTRDELVGGPLDGLAGRAKPAGRLGDGERVAGEDAEGVTAHVGFALLAGDPVGRLPEQAGELDHICDEAGHGGIDAVVGQAKLLGALWIGAQARRHGDLRLLKMSPGNTVGTGVNRDLPAPVRVLAPRVIGLLGRSHSLAGGTERLAAGLLDLAYGDGRFWASPSGRLTGPVVDQATINPVMADPDVQDAACEAIERYAWSSGRTLAARAR